MTRHRSRCGQVDDTPYGGGAGMVIRVDVVEAALRARYGIDPLDLPGTRRVIALRPEAASSTTLWPPSWPRSPSSPMLCGRYEGFDERVHEHLATDVVSIGPTRRRAASWRRCRSASGERSRSVRSDTTRARSRNHSAGRSRASPEYTHYTRPFDWHGHTVPEILVSGDHARIREWRLAQSRERGLRDS